MIRACVALAPVPPWLLFPAVSCASAHASSLRRLAVASRRLSHCMGSISVLERHHKMLLTALDILGSIFARIWANQGG